jgi:hypothetical protein
MKLRKNYRGSVGLIPGWCEDTLPPRANDVARAFGNPEIVFESMS